MCVQNLVEFSPSIFKILSKNQFLTSIKGCNSIAKVAKNEALQYQHKSCQL